MTAVADPTRRAAADLAVRCRPCYQCGRCRSACPQGLDLAGGPRAVVRLILAGEVEALLDCEDVWRCTECGACTQACPMERGRRRDARRGPAAAAGRRSGPTLSGAERGGHRRPAAGDRRTLNPLTLGLAMAARGFLPQHRAGAVSAGARARGGRVVTDVHAIAPPAPRRGVFFPGCALRLDRGACAATPCPGGRSWAAAGGA